MQQTTAAQKKSLLAAGLAHGCQDGLDASTYILLPVLAGTFGFTYAQVGAIKAGKSLALGLLELASGFISERFGETNVLIVGLLIAGTGYAAVSATTSVPLVVCCLIIVGIGGGLQHAPASTLVSRTYNTENRRSALGLYNSLGDVGKLLLTAIFSIAISAGAAWQPIVFSYGSLTVFVAIVIVALSSTPTTDLLNQANTKIQKSHDAFVKGWGIRQVSHFSILLFIVFLDNVVQVGVLLFIAFLMLSNGLSASLAMLATTMVLIGGVAGKASGGYLAQRLGVRRAFVSVQILTAAGLIAVISTPSWLAFMLLVPLGVVSQGSTSITYGLLPDYIHPERIARGYSLLYSSASVAAAAGAWLVGLSADWFGINIAFLLMAFVSVLALVPLIVSTEFARHA